MGELNITGAESGGVGAVIKDYSVDTENLDSSGGQKEVRWQNNNWSQQLGYYKKIPELQASINAKEYWTVGKGVIVAPDDKITQMILDSIRGNGTDTFNTILGNMIRTYCIGGDAYAEIIRDKKGVLINLKVLDSGNIVIISNRKGRIIRYEQVSKLKGNKPQTWTPEEIFHLPRNRLGGEVHGNSLIDPLENLILFNNEMLTDYKILLHRNVFPVRIWHLDTDVPAKVAAFKAKVAASKSDREDIFIPKGAVETEIAAVPSNSTLNPLPAMAFVTARFYQAAEVPQIIVGGGSEITEAGVKIAYLAYQQPIEKEQLFIEQQVGMQLGLAIELNFPASLENEMLSDKKKEESMQAATPEDTSLTEADGQVAPVGAVQ